MQGFIILLLMGIELPNWARTANAGPHCLWACVTTLGRLHNITEVDQALLNRHVLNKFSGFKHATDEEVIAYLDKLGARYKITKHYTKDFSLLEEYGEKYGVAITFRPGFRRGWSFHSVLVTSFSATKVEYWDPNYPSQKFLCSRQWFNYWWTGGSLVVLSKEQDNATDNR